VNCSQQLILNRSISDLSSLHFTTVVGEEFSSEPVKDMVKKFKVQLMRVLWKIPVIKFDDREKLKLLKITDSKKMLNCAFRNLELCEYPNLPQTSKHSWMVKTCSQVERPRCIIIAFLTNAPSTVADGYNVDYDACSLTKHILIQSNTRMKISTKVSIKICSPCSTRITLISRNIIMSDLTLNRVLRENSIKSWAHIPA